MYCESLSPMIIINENTSFYDACKRIYQDYFLKSELVTKNNLTINNLPVYFNKTITQSMYDMFWHLISFDFKKEKYDISPCTNLLLQKKCIKEKKRCNAIINIPISNRLKDRSDCFYRLCTIHWLDEIIILKNLGDPLVKYWEETIRNKHGAGYNTYGYLRFEEDTVDYVIVLQINNGRYELITAYPVTMNGSKHEFDKKYSNYIDA